MELGAPDRSANSPSRINCGPHATLTQVRADLGGIGHSKFYELVATKKLELVKLGGKSLVTGRSIKALKSELLAQLAA
ncbi:hypothetical protein J2Y58_004185 [Sphingomonas sp. BE138]|nr:hypothetical protein [Sphingomonas sp. BE138]